MSDPRVQRLARVLVHYSAHIEAGDRVLIEADHEAEPLVRELIKEILGAGGHPMLVPHRDFHDTYMALASPKQLTFTNPLKLLAYDTFESRIRVWSERNTKALSNTDKERIKTWKQANQPILKAQFERGAQRAFKWVTTLFPTPAYAQDAEMSLEEFEQFVFQACHVQDEQDDPVAYWREVERKQQRIVEAVNGRERVRLKSPNCDLTLSVEGRTFLNSCGRFNMPDGEVYTGPVEETAEGWVYFGIPSVLNGNEVQGVHLEFDAGKVVSATAEKNQAFLDQVLETDEGARYIGEFAIGLNDGIQRPIRNILFDEKIGGTFHLALGGGYPETGSKNKSAIHWDLICDIRSGGEIAFDGEVLFRDGKFVP